MTKPYLTEENISHFIRNAFMEDIGPGDHSSLATMDDDLLGKAKLLVKSDGILAGMAMAEKIFKAFDENLMLEILMQDGDTMKYGDIAFYVEGSARSILSTERIVLNCMQRMSGIATYTNGLQKMIAHTKCKVLDTRKTTPNFRICEKWAVTIGGGNNHRYGLYDMVMLKDNHIDYCGGIEKAVAKTKQYLAANDLKLAIEVETRNLDEVKQALNAKVERIMLDNMSTQMMKTAVNLINGQCEVEASGGITEENIVEVAETGVNFISMGALTHSVKSKDLSLKAV